MFRSRMTWVVDGRTFARKVKNPTYGVHGNCGGGRSIECPSCGFVLDQINLAHHWPGLPAGVKFDPSDQELLEHLAAKLGLDCSKVHPFIDEFIPTLNEEDGICYTHPQKLPGVRYDGSSIHFFNRPARAYTTGTRKRRKVQPADDNGNGIEMRWHKTGKTRPILKDGKQIGCKKIMVLYVSTGKKTKPDKTFWVMHQYHLGVDDDEKDGELVVSKVFYQTQPRCVRKEDGDDSECVVLEVSGQCEHVVLEASRQQAPSSHQSSPSTMSNSNTSYAVPSPKTPGPFLSDAVKQPKGLLATLTEDVDKLKSSLSSHSQSTVQTSDQSVMALGLNFVALDCKSASKVQESVSDLFHDSSRLGEMDTSCSGQEMVESEKGWEPIGMFSASGFRTSLIELPAFEGHHISDVLDPYVLKLLSEENLDITLKLKGGDEVMRTSTNEAAENGGLRDETVQKVDSLDNIILDTPPDFLMESLPNSQELTEWLAKKKLWSDSSQKTEDGSFLDFLKDSQSSV